MLAANMRFGTGTFIAQRDISVFRSIDKLVDEPIIEAEIEPLKKKRNELMMMIKAMQISQQKMSKIMTQTIKR